MRSRDFKVICCFAIVGLVTPGDGAVQGQDIGQGFALSGASSYFGGTTSYLPFGATMGGFLPYNPMPGAGLGVQPGVRGFGMSVQPGGLRMPGSMSAIGQIRSTTTPLAPIGLRQMRSGPLQRMESMGGLIPRSPARGSMGRMVRPPVGSYPFRQPPSLLGPATAGPAMSM
jgi:hypothetical protein